MPWKDFEKEACKFLKEKIKDKKINIDCFGGSDSTAKDIKISKKNKYLATIEVKERKAQIGQLVIEFIPKNSIYKLSKKSKDYEVKLKISNKILNFINKSPSYYQNISQSTQLKCDKDLSYDYIEKFNKLRNYDYFLSKNFENHIKIINVKNFKRYFDVSAVLRPKPSGSRHIPKKDYEIVKIFIYEKFKLKVLQEKNKYYIKFLNDDKKNIQKIKDRYFFIKNDKYFLSMDEDDTNRFYIKKCSKTNNLNIIFEIEFISNEKDDDLNNLLNNLKD